MIAISRLIVFVAFALLLWGGVAAAAAPQDCPDQSALSAADFTVDVQDGAAGKADTETAQCHARCQAMWTGVPDRPCAFVGLQRSTVSIAIRQDDRQPSAHAGRMLRPPRA